MIEISYFLPKKGLRYTLCIGHGAKYHGQMSFISLVREYFNRGEIDYAEVLFKS